MTAAHLHDLGIDLDQETTQQLLAVIESGSKELSKQADAVRLDGESGGTLVLPPVGEVWKPSVALIPYKPGHWEVVYNRFVNGSESFEEIARTGGVKGKPVEAKTVKSNVIKGVLAGLPIDLARLMQGSALPREDFWNALEQVRERMGPSVYTQSSTVVLSNLESLPYVKECSMADRLFRTPDQQRTLKRAYNHVQLWQLLSGGGFQAIFDKLPWQVQE
jgi:hypothetical protein